MTKVCHIFFSLLLLLSISWQCGAKTVIYFRFRQNQEKLAETVCENKNKAGSCCKAKCYLAKELKKEDKRQSDLPASLKEKIEKPELCSGYLSFSAVQSMLLVPVCFPYVQAKTTAYPTAVFHPPAPWCLAA